MSLQSLRRHVTSSLKCIRRRFRRQTTRCAQTVYRTLRRKRLRRTKSNETTLRKGGTSRPLMFNLRMTVKSQRSQNRCK